MPITRPTRHDVRIFDTAADFRAWLDAHHDSADALFVGYYRKGVDRTAMTYPESVDEALCYGWIDGITYRVDDEVRAIRFTPRRPTSTWSAINIAKIAALKAAGRMHPAGLRVFESRDRRKDQSYSYEQPVVELGADVVARFRADTRAWEHWQAASPSFRRMASYWVMSAKRPETRERRFAELLEASRAGRRPKAFIVER